MACTIDHLRADHRVRVIRDFRDARGVEHKAGETAYLRRMDIDWPRQEIVFDWDRDGRREKLYFRLDAREGPGNGRMREYFALEEPVPILNKVTAERPFEIPEVAPEPVTDVARYAEASTRVWALAALKRFAEAEEQMRLILDPPDPFEGRLDQLAGDMVGIATAHARDPDPAVYEWARRKAIQLLETWGSRATGAGEGIVRSKRIKEALAHLARCEEMRASG